MDSAFKTTALCIAVLCNLEKDANATWEMMDYLKGPESVNENPYSFDEENWATLYVTSGGADSPRPIKLRRKPSTNQWFINDIQDISPFKLGNYCWSGYTCRSFGYPYIMLESSEKTDRILLMILTENGENKISFSDSDVQEIMKSIVAGRREGEHS